MGLDKLVEIATINGGTATKEFTGATSNTVPTQPHSSFNPNTAQAPPFYERSWPYVPPTPKMIEGMPPLPKPQPTSELMMNRSGNSAPFQQSMHPHGLLEDVECANRMTSAFKTLEKNRKEQVHWGNINNAGQVLSCKQIIPLDFKVYSSTEHVTLPSLVKAAQEIFDITGLDHPGICIQILGAISLATWGRVSVRPNNNWLEPTVSMLLQVSPAGTKKSADIAVLRKPFDTFCNEKNKDRDMTPKDGGNRVKRNADKAHDQKLTALFKEDGITPASIEQAKKMTDAHEALIKGSFSLVQAKPRIRILIDNVTTTELGKILSEQGECQGCITAEGNMLQSHLLGKEAAPQLFNRTHTQEPYESHNVRYKIALKHPAFPMVNLVQASVAIKFYKNAELNDLGVTGRFVPYFHNGNKTTNNGISCNDGIATYNNVIARLLNEYYTQDADAEKYTVGLEVEAYRLSKQFEQNIAQTIIPNAPSSAEPCYRKLHGQAVRFAWAIHAWNNDKPHLSLITAEEMSQAIELCRFLIPHIKYAYDPCGLTAFDDAIKVIKCITTITTQIGYNTLQSEGIDSRTIQQRAHINAPRVTNALLLLQQHNALVILDNGMRNVSVVLHPQFFAVKMY